MNYIPVSSRLPSRPGFSVSSPLVRESGVVGVVGGGGDGGGDPGLAGKANPELAVSGCRDGAGVLATAAEPLRASRQLQQGSLAGC